MSVVSPSLAADLISCEDLFFNRPNRLFAGVYWFLFVIGFCCFALHGFQHIPNPHLSEGHKLWGSLWVFLSWAQYIYVMYSDPGRVNTENVKSKLDEWAYDDIFYEAKWCSTCNLQRPARAKHCRVCNHCVSRFDHHCIWINGCVGQTNLIAFILFLINHTIIMIYICIVGSAIAWSTITELDLFNAYYFDEAGQQVQASYGMILHYVLRTHPVIFSISVFTGLLSLLFAGFLAFQLYLVSTNLTTNEFFKWGDIKRLAKQEGHLEWIPTVSPFSLGFFKNWMQSLFPSCLNHSGVHVERMSAPQTTPDVVATKLKRGQLYKKCK